MTFEEITAFFNKIITEGFHYNLYSAYDVDKVSMEAFNDMELDECFQTGTLTIQKVHKDWIIMLDIKDNTYSFIFLHERKWMMKSRNIVTGEYSIFLAN